MQHFMLQRLRSDLARAKTQQRALIATSRSKPDESESHPRGRCWAILGATSFEQLLQTVTTDLAVLLDVDVVTIGVESAASAQPRLPLHGIQILRRGTVDDLLGAERDTLLRADTAGDAALFGSGAGRSSCARKALLRLDVSEQRAGRVCALYRHPPPGQV